ncbi:MULTISPECIES: hypothetical protein [Streptomyces]|uniref:ATP synthase protein I n=2 Tax=Streptomyces avermitilis TaxID=33903 RepID=Q82J77_STRAW|nr:MULTISPECIES: hypothetical protein [Streptomyces]KUN57372.1 ATP synthase I [Streptomyces avermitilis]MYS98485.1 hypothetical protein [Streptomyces sp. SID5469]OOV33125.1 hypothetical protein SM007_10300 [Streptomyces avermitilis]BAC70599.1 putative ATP synthase protein I [Streptomyces avermitilis MA-4680 = NBRC 14893]BBJ50711.1 ATP synthase protein I [Streptomyces avermitilis]
MQSNDARTLLHCALPTAAAGVVGVAVSAAVAGGKGALGAGFGTVLVLLFMCSGLVVLLRTARSLPHLFQMMGLLLYTTQILLLMILLTIFRGTSVFNPKCFALTLLAATLVWIAAQVRSHMKAKVLYVEPDSARTPS